MKLATKGLPAHLLAHLKSMHGYGSRLHLEARDGNSVSAEPQEGSRATISLFDMERGLIDYKTVEAMNPFLWNREVALAGGYKKQLDVGPGQVGVYSTSTYAGLAYISLTMNQETLTAYFDLSGMMNAQQLPEVEKLVLVILSNERGARRDETFKDLYVHSRINSTAVLEDLQSKKLVRLVGGHGEQYRSITITAPGREVLSHIKYPEQRTLFNKFLGRPY